jgi:hypothetical protein
MKLRVLIIAGSVIVVLLLIILLISQQKNKTSTTTTLETPVPTVEQDNPYTFPTTASSLQTSAKGQWFSHKGLQFKIPEDWKISTASSGDDTVFAQPANAADIRTLPRMLINVDTDTDADYIKPDVRYAHYGVDNVTFSKFQNIDLAYKTPEAYDSPDASGNLRKINEMVVILKYDDTDFRVVFQYPDDNSKDSDIKLFEDIIGSLHYQ